MLYKGRIVGSNNLNDGFRRTMKARLQDVAHYLERDSGRSLDQILDDVVEWFEINKKNFRGPQQPPMFVPVPWLKENVTKGFFSAQAEVSK